MAAIVPLSARQSHLLVTGIVPLSVRSMSWPSCIVTETELDGSSVPSVGGADACGATKPRVQSSNPGIGGGANAALLSGGFGPTPRNMGRGIGPAPARFKVI